MASFYSVVLDLANVPCLVVGGGLVAQRKIQELIEAKAKITVVSPTLVTELTYLHSKGAITYTPRRYVKEDIEGMRLVFALTDDARVNANIAQDARRVGAFVNVSDNPKLCSFVVPAVVHRGDVHVAVSSSGRSPALTRALRQYLERVLPTELEELANYFGVLRKQILSLDLSAKERHECLKSLVTADLYREWQQGEIL